LHRRARRVNGCVFDPSLGARYVVRKAIVEPDNNESGAAYTLIRENLHERSWEDEMTRSIAWDKVSHADVLRAIQEYDRLGPERFFSAHGFAPTTTYDLVWDKRRYPPKAILGTAYEFATDQPLASGDFEGGKTGAVKVLGKLGFTIQPRHAAT
jgi:hypothetical protein